MVNEAIPVLIDHVEGLCVCVCACVCVLCVCVLCVCVCVRVVCVRVCACCVCACVCVLCVISDTQYYVYKDVGAMWENSDHKMPIVHYMDEISS